MASKGADTFGPVGPYIVTGLDYDDLLVQLRLNGEVKQQERTDHLIHDVASRSASLASTLRYIRAT